MSKKYETKFSGTKQEYSSGATRDNSISKGKYVLISPMALKRLAGVYERGAANHGDRNWEKGFPISRALDSAIRHIFQYIEGLRDEDHLAQAAWNIFAAIHFEEMIERGKLPGDLNDLPNYQIEKIEQNFDMEVDKIEHSFINDNRLTVYDEPYATGPGSRSYARLQAMCDGYGWDDGTQFQP